MRTSISIQGLQLFGHHGLYEEERRLGQRFLFDVRCHLAEVRSHRDDRLERSIGYDRLADDVARISGARKFQTVEALAEDIARGLLGAYPPIASVEVGVSKACPPMAHVLQAARVEIAMSRDEL
ncbi:dihydroneopterin aldolase [Roseateles sp. DAIF2]|uniref:dihydroneopterin aldolase n=1 Tax=Roseateles sp. DAIF2 TaxID=2714952 RepID=UPI0018A29038|nr:dihydroneopterin aldolase [Roseateles sp. DAIF2]QPF76121.1 dihydroneopterin aldolase [Roseateles sp. DAIF2]